MASCGDADDSATIASSTPVLEQDATATQVPEVTASESGEPAAESILFEEVAVWGRAADGDTSFSSPNGVAVDSSDNVYVTEFRGNRVQKFTPDGTLLLQWGTSGGGNGQFRNPTGIALDLDGNVYVSESGNHRVQKFTADGEWLATWGSQGSGPGESFSATVVAVDADGRVYVGHVPSSGVRVRHPVDVV